MSTAGDAPQAAARPRRGPGKQKKTIKIPALLREQGRETALNRHWRAYFLAALVETSNITKAAAAAGVTASRAYRVRQEDPEFRALWMGALAEGYHNLEMEVLGYLRDPQPGFKMDVANALRLLDRHRQLVAQQRALEDNRDEAEVLASIDAMIDQMRQRSAANALLLAAPESDHVQGK